MKKRDRRPIIPSRTSLTEGSDKQSSLFDDIYDAVPESMGSEKDDTSSAFYLKGEGTSKSGDKQSNIVIQNQKLPISSIYKKDKSPGPIFPPNPKNDVIVYGPDKKKLRSTNKKRAEKWVNKNKARWLEDKSGKNRKAIQLLKQPLGRSKNSQLRVSVLSPDGVPLMPTTSARASKWIRDKKAIPKRKANIFYVQLFKEPSGRNKQPISLTLDPGSRFSGIAICSKKQILYTCNLELIADEKKNSFASIKNRMNKRRELRRGRRYRKCRRRPSRFLNRSKTGKMAPSIRSRKQLELKIIKDICQIYPISVAGIEDVSFNHYKNRWGKYFSQVEIGKKWLYEEMKKIIPDRDIRLIKGFDTNIRRQQLKLKKSSIKEERDPSAHVTDCIAMGSIILGLGINIKTQLRSGINFDIITRPKYSRRKLHNEQPGKGGIRERFGGTTSDWTNIRKGDYVEAIINKRDKDMLYRGWVGGFKNDEKLISLYNFDWKRIGQFDEKKVRLLNRNHGLLVKSMEIEVNRVNICKYGTSQRNILDAW